ncbi:PQQ-like beta-propeller repeat protein [Cryomorpha ignava]|uniref:PQQ-like beta-propeller repeat protein n=1 Tax=Cryomorpha ignava TaxID=101383 RepID=A0A7K3WUS4_9FLAO|nr:PQQ-binding-like beta-propeller repeat protein [Cryomorpha ignava]NEN25246.1 PQQ-like beta-propeller repeat protein [Cryomorpha ignava]
MKRINLILAVVVLFSLHGFAQKEITVLTSSKVVGNNLLTGEPIMAKIYTFPERVHDFQIDTINNDLIIQLRGLRKGKWLANKGEVIRYDIDKNKVLWFDKIAYQVESIEQYGGVTLHTTGGKSYCLDNLTGQKLWEVKNSLIFADPVDKIGIGYKIQASRGKENMLEGIDLTNGQPIWQREISREYSWNDAFYLNDSTLLIAASGLHTLNIFDGAGWDFNTITGKKDYTASAVGTGLGIAAGLLTGMYSVSTGHNLVRDVVSNVLVDSLHIYFASKEHLVKLNREGEVLWQKSLPNDLTSKSLIFKFDDNLVMVNRGYAYMGNRQLDFGTPFIASFDLNSGDQKYMVTVSNEKKEIIKAIDLTDEELLFVFNDHVSKYSVITGQLIKDQQFNIGEYGELNYFIGEQVFVKRDSLLISLPTMDSTKHYLVSVHKVHYRRCT